MTQQARYDKRGRRLPDTGRGCGCRQCEVANAPRYERRSEPRVGLRSKPDLYTKPGSTP